MRPATTLQDARRRSGLTQRELGRRAGVPQSVIARIESGGVTPRVDTLDRLLRVCGSRLEAMPRLGVGIDRSQISERLAWTPRRRIEEASLASRSLGTIRRGVRRRAR